MNTARSWVPNQTGLVRVGPDPSNPGAERVAFGVGSKRYGLFEDPNRRGPDLVTNPGFHGYVLYWPKRYHDGLPNPKNPGPQTDRVWEGFPRFPPSSVEKVRLRPPRARGWIPDPSTSPSASARGLPRLGPPID